MVGCSWSHEQPIFLDTPDLDMPDLDIIDPERLHQFASWSRELNENELQHACKGISIRKVPKGSAVFEQGDLFDAWIGVTDGLLKMRTISVDGKEVSFAGLHAGAWFGEGSVIKGEKRRYEIIALRDTQLALLERETFLWLFENSLPFNRFLVHQFNERLGQFIAQVEYDRLLGTTTRVARTLSLLLNPVLYPDVGNEMKITQEELGLLAGITRPIANQALKKLEALEIIKLEYGGIRVLDAARLNTIMD